MLSFTKKLQDFLIPLITSCLEIEVRGITFIYLLNLILEFYLYYTAYSVQLL